MATFKQLHHPDFSLWQSAVEQTVAKIGHTLEELRGEAAHAFVHATSAVAAHLGEHGVSPAQQGQVPAAGDAEGAAKYCASVWWEIAQAQIRGDKEAEQEWREQIGAFTSCDPRYAQAVEQYVKFKLEGGQTPYKRWQNLSDFIIDWKVPANARIAIVGDWGTGQADARALLQAIARKNPDLVIHLGDIYYAGTQHEIDNYFMNFWKATFDLSKIRTFTLAGNHDMYSGGAPYYRLIEELGQPASYFCLRNDDWQFIALDTGLHDDDALDAKPTYLEDTEVEWLKDKIATAGGRRTMLLSHHQLYTAKEDIGGQAINERLMGQVGSILPSVDMWLWGHEHDQVIYRKWQGVLARCIGHGAYPVGITELPDKPKFDVPMENAVLSKGEAFYSHGYVIMDLDGRSARLSYYQDSDPEDQPMFSETIGAAVATAGAAGATQSAGAAQ